MTDQAARLCAALDTLIDKLGQTTRWLAEIEGERRAAVVEIDKLRTAIRGVVPLLPGDEAARRLARLDGLTSAHARPGPPADSPAGARSGRTGRMAAVMQLLATHPAGTIHTTELQRHLRANSMASDSRAAARALAKKARQGVVERVDRGTYRIMTDHPALVRARAAPVS